MTARPYSPTAQRALLVHIAAASGQRLRIRERRTAAWLFVAAAVLVFVVVTWRWA